MIALSLLLSSQIYVRKHSVELGECIFWAKIHLQFIYFTTCSVLLYFGNMYYTHAAQLYSHPKRPFFTYSRKLSIVSVQYEHCQTVQLWTALNRMSQTKQAWELKSNKNLSASLLRSMSLKNHWRCLSMLTTHYCTNQIFLNIIVSVQS